jgi:rare lipoprotein A
MKRTILILLAVPLLFLSYCSSGGERWDVISEPKQPPKERPKKEDKAERPKAGKTQESRQEIKSHTADLSEFDEPEFIDGSDEFYQRGVASWYGEGDNFDGKRTANGEIYDMDKLTAAHKKLPFHTRVEVENTKNGKKVIVRINDRGPFLKGRIIDLSREAAKRIGMMGQGTAPVKLRILKAPNNTEIVQLKPEIQTDSQLSQPQKSTVNDPPPLQDENAEISVEDTSPKPPPPPVIATTTTTETKTSTEKNISRSSSIKYHVQAGAFKSEKNARRFLRRIGDIVPDGLFNVHFQDGLFKVYTVALESREAADILVERLKQLDINAFIKEK